MGKKSANFNKAGIGNLADDKPVVYNIETAGGNTNYVGIAKRGRVQERLGEHLGDIPGAKVKIKQFDSIADARAAEARAIKRQQPKYNDQGK